ncbi:hypothetical protein KBI52_20665 [Microvirga sp. HBU67558]|uniref:hypothetical protein n=1 Tax=Microvirga sp. HBU67558 TaxID=2824562 RepID=UPI001B36F013|nr:hypothetical protein [Microvirga sp. HBU67558]MBQ0822603.1 hypothetical protein [Microvirga sp. HBU67558]
MRTAKLPGRFITSGTGSVGEKTAILKDRRQLTGESQSLQENRLCTPGETIGVLSQVLEKAVERIRLSQFEANFSNPKSEQRHTQPV